MKLRFIIALIIAIRAALLGLTVWGCFGLTKHAIVAIDKLGDAGAGLAQTTARVNGKHGTIAMLDEDVGAAKSLIVHADLVARHEQQQLVKWDSRGEILFNNVNGGITDLRGTIRAAGNSADAAGDTADAAARLVEDLRVEMKDKNHGLGATLDNVNGAVTDARSLTPDARRVIKASAGTMEHVEGVAGDGHKVADHYEHAIDDPKKVPLWLRILPPMARLAVQAYLEHLAMQP